MGVITCDRLLCGNIMCDTNINAGANRHGIDICNECIEEFINHPFCQYVHTDDEIKGALVKFMYHPKTSNTGNANVLKDFFKRNNTRPNLFEEE